MNRFLTYSSSDKTVKIWNAGSRQCVHTFYDHSDQVSVWRQKKEIFLSIRPLSSLSLFSLSISLSLTTQTKGIVFLVFISYKWKYHNFPVFCIILCVLLSLSPYILFYNLCSTLTISLCSVLHSMFCSTIYVPLLVGSVILLQCPHVLFYCLWATLKCPYFLLYSICSIVTVYLCLIPHCMFFSYSILMFFHSVVSTPSVSLCCVPYCMFYLNMEIMCSTGMECQIQQCRV